MQLKLSSQHHLLALVLLYSVLAAVFYPATFFALLPYNSISTLAGAPIMSLMILPVIAFIYGAHSPFRYFREVLRREWFAILVIMTAFWLFMSAFTTLKIRLVSTFGFYADPAFADMDHALFGQDAWHFSRKFISPEMAIPIGACYGGLWFMYFLGTIVYASFFRSGFERTRYLYAFVITWILLGTIMASALSSAGPIFFDRIHGTERFRELLASLTSAPYTQLILMEADYLYRGYSLKSADIGTGISAMPSVHVGLVVLNAIYFSSISKTFGAFMWIFAAIVMIGSIYTGFHYAIDGIVSLAIVPLFWWASGRFAKYPN